MIGKLPPLYMLGFTGILDLIVDTTNGDQEKAEMLKQIDFWFASKRRQKNPYQEILRLSDG